MINVTLLGTKPYLDLPYDLIGWVGWFCIAALILWGIRKNLTIPRSKQFWGIFIILLLAAGITSILFVVKVPWSQSLPLPNIPRENNFPQIMVFSALPWLLAAGFLGVWPAVVIGFVTGLVSSLLNTHTIFTPLETAFFALIAGYALRQNYRTKVFHWLRRPIGAAVFVILLSSPLLLLSTFFSTNGVLSARLDYAFTQSWLLMVINGIQVLIAGILCDLFLVTRSRYWIQNKIFQPSPFETGLQDRVLYTALPLVLALLITLAIADWVVAGKAARNLMRTQLQGTASIAAENIPAVVDTGQGLLLDVINSKIPTDDKTETLEFLKGKLRSFPFFTQLFVFDLTGMPIVGYPAVDISQYQLSPEEQAAIALALNGVTIQSYVIAPITGEKSAQVAYIGAIPDEYGLAKGVITARTNLSVNLFSQPALQALEEIKNAGGEGVILDDTNRILFETNPGLILSTYEGKVPDISGYFEDTTGVGTRRLVYAAIPQGKGWKILLSLPASYAQELALQIAVPLLAISMLISLAAYVLLRLMLGTVTTSLVKLAHEADEISRGGLDNEIQVSGVDEVGRLSSAFEQMRVSLKGRLKELDTLLDVSQGIASNIGIENTSPHLLKASLSYGADSARLVLIQGSLYGMENDSLVYKDGKDADVYAALDNTLFDQLKEEPIMILPSKARIKRMGISKSSSIPSALAGISLREGNKLFGILWIAYSEPHRFHDDEIRFINTLAGQAVLAVSNSSLYLKAEIGKKRLESVLSSTPEPVLVVGQDGSLLLANQAAREVPGLVLLEGTDENSIGTIISPALSSFVRSSQNSEVENAEIKVEIGKIFSVSISPVLVEETRVGKVCVLRDITEFRELEKMKSDFVATVSHDLRNPMGIIRGYATMLQMVGELNIQQKEYSAKIVSGLENIDKMVEKLLDMERIESGMDLQLETLSPSELLDQVILLLKPLAVQRKVQVQRELTLSQESNIVGDRALLQQALYNLLENAIKFSPLNNQVNLRLQTEGESVIFEIQDHGPGIAPLDIETIFEKINKVNKSEAAGVRPPGMGLSIVKSIVDRHNGKVWVKSKLGKGSTFFMEIPKQQQL